MAPDLGVEMIGGLVVEDLLRGPGHDQHLLPAHAFADTALNGLGKEMSSGTLYSIQYYCHRCIVNQ